MTCQWVSGHGWGLRRRATRVRNMDMAGHERTTSTALSKIESDVAPGLAATDQQIAIRRRFDRVWPIDDGAGNQPGLAVMTNSGAARPTHRHIASLRQFEKAVECGTPADNEIAARKGYDRPDARGSV